MELLGHAVTEPLYRVPFVTSFVFVMALPKSEAARWTSILGGRRSGHGDQAPNTRFASARRACRIGSV